MQNPQNTCRKSTAKYTKRGAPSDHPYRPSQRPGTGSIYSLERDPRRGPKHSKAVISWTTQKIPQENPLKAKRPKAITNCLLFGQTGCLKLGPSFFQNFRGFDLASFFGQLCYRLCQYIYLFRRRTGTPRQPRSKQNGTCRSAPQRRRSSKNNERKLKKSKNYWKIV